MEPTARARAVWRWLNGTLGGRGLLGGAAVKLCAWLAGVLAPDATLVDLADTAGDVALVVGGVLLGSHLFRQVKGVLLWRVRRKLTLSYIFIGVVPALLIVTFFVLSGLLLFFNVSAYSLRMRVAAIVDQAQLLAETAAVDVEGTPSPADGRTLVQRRFEAAATRYPGVAYAVVGSEQACASRTGDQAGAPAQAAPDPMPPSLSGTWTHAEAPTTVPDWVPCEGYGALVVSPRDGGTQLAARGVAPLSIAPGRAVVVDIPLGEPIWTQIEADAGLEIESVATMAELEAAEEGGDARPAVRLEPATLRRSGLSWVAFLDATDWTSGATTPLLVSFRTTPSAVYERISGGALSTVSHFSMGQILLILMAAVGGLFLVIQLVALGMGLTLARSITGAVHELFVGTERVGQGDFTHKIPVRSRDQLGELASSFNAMTGSMEYLLKEKAEKERMEQELRIARAIQRSLLPQGAFQLPGLAVTAYCEPAREIGGDYYDYLPIDDRRLGLLIADVSGKGASAALYMAELKGVILTLSQRHTSPRDLLIEANRIMSRHLDSASFITVTYAVLDRVAQTLTYARAGHCPLIHVPGPSAPSRAARILTPDGMVLGLQLDDGQTFARVLEEATIQLSGGDLFVFYTDGLTEAMNPEGDCFGDARLGALVAGRTHLYGTELGDEILREVRAFAGSTVQQDDMTMLLLRIDNLDAFAA